jgi:hypothetical protein
MENIKFNTVVSLCATNAFSAASVTSNGRLMKKGAFWEVRKEADIICVAVTGQGEAVPVQTMKAYRGVEI